MAVSKIPQGFSTVTPSIMSNDAAKAIDLYAKAFGAKEMHRMNCPQTGKIIHACLQIGNSMVFIADTMPNSGCAQASSSNFYLYLDDVDSAFKKATQAGLEKQFDVQDMFWGDRTGTVKDPFGNSWTLATHVKDVSPEEMEEGRKKFMAEMAKSKAA